MTDERTARQAERVLGEAGKLAGSPAESPAAPDLPPDRTRRFTHVNFSRMRTQWSKNDKIVIEEIRRQAENVIFSQFMDAYSLLDRIYRCVRTPLVDETTGELSKNRRGQHLWKVSEIGLPLEDWTKVTDKDRFNWVHEITVHLFEWRQQAAALWGDAMFAKGIWEEVFAQAYVAPDKGTIDDRTQAGHLASMEDRYFSIFLSLLSRRADGIVSSMELICQRLKDTAAI